MLFNKVHAFFNPEQFQGWGKTKNYFEGWYFKVVNADATKAFAFIPGIAMDAAGNKHSFIQVLDGKKQTAGYHRFAADDFYSLPKNFRVSIQNNSFTESAIQLRLPGLTGELQFTGNIPWPKPWYSPGIMGPYAFVPFMECYHGIVSMDHRVDGMIIVNGEPVDFTNGRGYIEKDWGRSFPSAYFWMQSYHFSLPGISLKCSVAKIPWVRSSFVGFIAGIWLHNRLIKFTTYNQSKLITSFADEKKIKIVLENKQYRLEILAHRDAATELASPVRGFMEGRIEESMTSAIDVLLTDNKTKEILLNDTGKNAGLEVAGRIEEIFV